MKQFAVMVAACLTGFVLLILVGLAAIYVPSFFEAKAPFEAPLKRVENPKGFEFLTYQQLTQADKLTVVGVLQNNYTADWILPSVTVLVKNEGKLINSCKYVLQETMQPSSKFAFMIKCDDIQTPSETQNYQLELKVDSATEKPG